MQIVFNAKGYELSLAFSKKKPGPAVIVANGNNINVHDVADMMNLLDTRQAEKYAYTGR